MAKSQQSRFLSDVGKTILFCALFAILLSGLFPPWLYVYDFGGGTHFEKSAGYNFILSSPENSERPANRVKLDVSRLLLEWVCILAGSGMVWLMTHKEQVTQSDLRKFRDFIPKQGSKEEEIISKIPGQKTQGSKDL